MQPVIPPWMQARPRRRPRPSPTRSSARCCPSPLGSGSAGGYLAPRAAAGRRRLQSGPAPTLARTDPPRPHRCRPNPALLGIGWAQLPRPGCLTRRRALRRHLIDLSVMSESTDPTAAVAAPRRPRSSIPNCASHDHRCAWHASRASIVRGLDRGGHPIIERSTGPPMATSPEEVRRSASWRRGQSPTCRGTARGHRRPGRQVNERRAARRAGKQARRLRGPSAELVILFAQPGLADLRSTRRSRAARQGRRARQVRQRDGQPGCRDGQVRGLSVGCLTPTSTAPSRTGTNDRPIQVDHIVRPWRTTKV